MPDHMQRLAVALPELLRISSLNREIGYFGQEACRFYSMALSIKQSFPLTNESAEERQMTHTMTRSLLEGFFWLIYIFDDPQTRGTRYDEKLNAFRIQYLKFWNEVHIPKRSELEPADQAWSTLAKPLDVRSMLDQVTNDYGDRLSYLYFVYRVASFDTHGNSMSIFFEEVFGKPCSFSVLNLGYCFDLVANQYLVTLQALQNNGEI